MRIILETKKVMMQWTKVTGKAVNKKVYVYPMTQNRVHTAMGKLPSQVGED